MIESTETLATKFECHKIQVVRRKLDKFNNNVTSYQTAAGTIQQDFNDYANKASIQINTTNGDLQKLATEVERQAKLLQDTIHDAKIVDQKLEVAKSNFCH